MLQVFYYWYCKWWWLCSTWKKGFHVLPVIYMVAKYKRSSSFMLSEFSDSQVLHWSLSSPFRILCIFLSFALSLQTSHWGHLSAGGTCAMTSRCVCWCTMMYVHVFVASEQYLMLYLLRQCSAVQSQCCIWGSQWYLFCENEHSTFWPCWVIWDKIKMTTTGAITKAVPTLLDWIYLVAWCKYPCSPHFLLSLFIVSWLKENCLDFLGIH